MFKSDSVEKLLQILGNFQLLGFLFLLCFLSFSLLEIVVNTLLRVFTFSVLNLLILTIYFLDNLTVSV